MNIDVQVLFTLENKTFRCDISVDADEWERDPLAATLEELVHYKIDISRWYESRNVTVDWGKIVGKLTLDLTDTLPVESLVRASGWITLTAEVSDYEESIIADLASAFPVLHEYINCPVCIEFETELANLIPHINDNHFWTREEIAEWLESLPLRMTMSPSYGP